MAKSMKEIYQAGVEVATVLDSWKETSFLIGKSPESMTALCRRAIQAAEEILPGEALSTTLQIAEFLTSLDKNGEKALQTFSNNDVVLADAVRAELAACTPRKAS